MICEKERILKRKKEKQLRIQKPNSFFSFFFLFAILSLPPLDPLMISPNTPSQSAFFFYILPLPFFFSPGTPSIFFPISPADPIPSLYLHILLAIFTQHPIRSTSGNALVIFQGKQASQQILSVYKAAVRANFPFNTGNFRLQGMFSDAPSAILRGRIPPGDAVFVCLRDIAWLQIHSYHKCLVIVLCYFLLALYS